MMRKRGLGRGLSDLLSGEGLSQTRTVLEVSLDEIEPNPRQPRQAMEEDALEELTLSVEAHGVLQPILLRRAGAGYQIIAGERRWRAARRAGLTTVPCLIQDADDEQALAVAMIENLQRDDLNPLEAALGYRALLKDFKLTQEEVAHKVGKSRSAIANTLRLLDLPDAIQATIRDHRLSEGHGRALLPLVGREEFDEAFRLVLEEGLNVRETERLVRDILNPPAAEDPAQSEEAEVALQAEEGQPPKRGARDLVRDPHIAAAEQRLRTALAAKVVIRPSPKRGGVINIRYYDNSDLQRLLGMLGDGEAEE